LWFVIALVSLAVLITLILCVPIEIVLHANTGGRPKFSVRLIWLFGLIKTEIARAQQKSSEKFEPKSEHKPGIDWPQRLKAAFEILQTRGLLKQLGIFLRRAFKSVHIRELAANLKVDLENPADTGLLFAFIAPANLALNYFLPYPIKIEPVFTGDSFLSGYFNCGVRLLPIQVAGSLFGLALSLPAFRVAKKMVINKWKRKR
jgi:hypothetical protein